MSEWVLICLKRRLQRAHPSQQRARSVGRPGRLLGWSAPLLQTSGHLLRGDTSHNFISCKNIRNAKKIKQAIKKWKFVIRGILVNWLKDARWEKGALQLKKGRHSNRNSPFSRGENFPLIFLLKKLLSKCADLRRTRWSIFEVGGWPAEFQTKRVVQWQ